MNDKQLIIKWFESIEKLAKEQTNSNGAEMDPLEVLNEIAVKAKDAKEYIDKFVTSDPIKKGEDFLKSSPLCYEILVAFCPSRSAETQGMIKMPQKKLLMPWATSKGMPAMIQAIMPLKLKPKSSA